MKYQKKHIIKTEIDNQFINAIGEAYLKKFSEKNIFRFFTTHHSHDSAKNLAQYQKNTTSEEKWYFLVSIYQNLNNIYNSELGTAIENVFYDAFDEKIKKFNFITNCFNPYAAVAVDERIPIAKEEIINQMKKMIANHYDSEQNKKAIHHSQFVEMSSMRR